MVDARRRVHETYSRMLVIGDLERPRYQHRVASTTVRAGVAVRRSSPGAGKPSVGVTVGSTASAPPRQREGLRVTLSHHARAHG